MAVHWDCRQAAGIVPVMRRPCFAVNAEQYVELEPVPSPAPRNWLAEVAFATEDAEELRRYLVAHGVTVARSRTTAELAF